MSVLRDTSVHQFTVDTCLFHLNLRKKEKKRRLLKDKVFIHLEVKLFGVSHHHQHHHHKRRVLGRTDIPESFILLGLFLEYEYILFKQDPVSDQELPG